MPNGSDRTRLGPRRDDARPGLGAPASAPTTLPRIPRTGARFRTLRRAPRTRPLRALLPVDVLAAARGARTRDVGDGRPGRRRAPVAAQLRRPRVHDAPAPLRARSR